MKKDNQRKIDIKDIVSEVQEKKVDASDLTLSDKVDRFIAHKYYGILIFGVVMFIIFTISQTWLGPLISDLLGTIIGYFAGWVETGFILLNSTKEDQAKFESMFKELMVRTKKGKVDKRHNWVVFASGPDRRLYLIAGYPYTKTELDVRNEIIGEIISDENFGNARGCVVIGVQMDRLDYPYSVLARRASTNLFDTLTLQSET